jgi:gluconokinase
MCSPGGTAALGGGDTSPRSQKYLAPRGSCSAAGDAAAGMLPGGRRDHAGEEAGDRADDVSCRTGSPTELCTTGSLDPMDHRAWKPLIVVMGVSGSGKTTVGKALAAELGVPFMDADDLHPAANVAKMAAGHPLTDDDRWPWLARVGRELAEAKNTGLVIACSALKRAYRAAILSAEPRARFVDLEGSRDLLASRMAHREGHFMPLSLLDSQLATLEPLAATEPGVAVSLDSLAKPPELAAQAAAALSALAD